MEHIERAEQLGPPAGSSASLLTQTVAGRLLEYIRSQEVGPSGRLPPERVLSEHFEVSRSTLRKALNLLAAQGDVAPAPQSGWFITNVPYGPPPRQLLSFTEMARRRGLAVQTQVTHQLTRFASHEERQRLQPRDSDRVLELERIRLLEGEPICVERSVIALWLTPGLDGESFVDRSLYELMSSHGATPSRSDFIVSAALAGSISSALGIDASDPVLVGEELSYNQHGAPLHLSTSNYRASAYRFQATLTAARGGSRGMHLPV
ncbi:GntR family transcriptional regulator [Pseudoclavibacter sp. JSM 162008]|uniref:GntR family transcriptional regulator n=1 Tax=Pseudoclavibacter sp. JSM 162008 TaxID=3229855 RepID=UPI003523CDE0